MCPFFELNEGPPPFQIYTSTVRFSPTGFIGDPPPTFGRGVKLSGHFPLCQISLDTKTDNARDRKRGAGV